MAIYQHYARKGLIYSRKLNQDLNFLLQLISCNWFLYVPPEKMGKPGVFWWFRGYRKRTVALNGLISYFVSNISFLSLSIILLKMFNMHKSFSWIKNSDITRVASFQDLLMSHKNWKLNELKRLTKSSDLSLTFYVRLIQGLSPKKYQKRFLLPMRN